MGMYTEIFVRVELDEKTPQHVINILRYLFDDTFDEDVQPLKEHPFFDCPRWHQVGRCCSYYFTPKVTSDMFFDDTAETWFITSRSDLKAYHNEDKLFFEWLDDYVTSVDEGVFIGYSLYEEDTEPTLFYKKTD